MHTFASGLALSLSLALCPSSLFKILRHTNTSVSISGSTICRVTHPVAGSPLSFLQIRQLQSSWHLGQLNKNSRLSATCFARSSEPGLAEIGVFLIVSASSPYLCPEQS